MGTARAYDPRRREMDLMPSYSFMICQGEDAQHLQDVFFSAFSAPGVNFPSTCVNFPSTFCSPQGLSDTLFQSRVALATPQDTSRSPWA